MMPNVTFYLAHSSFMLRKASREYLNLEFIVHRIAIGAHNSTHIFTSFQQS